MKINQYNRLTVSISHQQGSSLDMDVSRPSMSGLDDAFRPNLDNAITNFDDNLPVEPPRYGTSYDELRRKNREDYQRQMNQPAASQRPQTQPPAQQEFYQRDVPIGRADQKNKYGDVWT